MMTVQQVLQRKTRQGFIFVAPETSILAALQLMADQNIGALLVMDQDVLAGVFSERDYARRVVLRGRSSAHTPVQAVMSTHVLYVNPNDAIDCCMALMTDKHVRHLPVLDDRKKVIGLISIGDVLSAIISHQQFTIEQLERYIQQ